MVKRCALLLVPAAVLWCLLGCHPTRSQDTAAVAERTIVALPKPEMKSKVTVEEALARRRSVRSYKSEPLTLQQVSQLLWAAQGITEPTKGLRTAPSAMALYPLRLYLVAGDVKDLPAGVYRYIPQGHKLELVSSGDQRSALGRMPAMRAAPAHILYAADYSVIEKRIGTKNTTWVDIEIGHSAQNVLLEEVALGLCGVGMGGIDKASIKSTLKLPDNEEPVYVVSAGAKA
jgi:SagB-type dehydrogenase family enzyme